MKMAFRVFILAVIATVVSSDSNKWNNNQHIRKKVLEGYDKMAFPHLGPNDTTTVYLNLFLKGLRMEDDKQILNVNAWTVMMWYDRRLKWDPKDYGNLDLLHVAYDEIWKPDILLYNNADITDINHYGGTHMIVFSNGFVVWVPPSIFRVECPYDLTYWPYDTQHCLLVLGSWTSDGWQLDLQLLHNSSEVSLGWTWKSSHEWQFVQGRLHRTEMYYACCQEPYVSLDIFLSLKRVSGTFTGTIVIPACAISALTLLQFLLPIREKKRLLIGCCCILLTLMEIVYLGSVIPRLSSSTPMIVKYFGQLLVVVTVSVAVTAILLRLTDSEHPGASTPPPNLLRTIVTGPLSSILFLQPYTEKVSRSGGSDEDGEVLDDSKNSVNYTHDWLLVAAVLDRLAALAFLATFVVTLIAYVAPV